MHSKSTPCSFAAVFLAALSFCFVPLTAQDDEGDVIERGRWFEIHCHFEGPKAELLAAESLELVEGIWEVAAKTYRLSMKRLSNRFLIHLYRLRVDYERVDQIKTRGAYKDVGQFTLFDTKETYILLQEVEDELFEKTGLIAPDRLALLKEACEICVKSAYDNHRGQPAWFFEGLKGYLRDQVMEEEGFITSLTTDPRESTQLSYVVELAEEDELPKVDTILTDNELADVDAWARTAVRESFFRFLCDQHWKEMRQFLVKVERLPGSTSLPGKMKTQLEGRLRREWDEINESFRAWIEEFEPEWREPYKSMWEVDDGLRQVAVTKDEARALRFRAPEKSTYTLTGSFELDATTNAGVTFVLDHKKDGLDSLSFIYIAVPVSGVVFSQLYDFSSDKPSDAQQWFDLGQAGSAGIKAGEKVDFKIEVEPGLVTLYLNDKESLVINAEGRDMEGRWGIGMRPGSAGTWRSLEVGS